MNRNDLKKELEALDINESFYSLDGRILPDRIILDQKPDGWIVFEFDERGNIKNKRKFLYEDQACLYFFELFKNNELYHHTK